MTTHPDTGKADDGRTVLGIVLGVDYKLPFSVKIDVGNVGGPSAGLMFSLGIYDKLTDGALTGGSVIAVTASAGGGGGGVAFMAHVAGFVAGMGAVLLFRKKQPPQEWIY